MIKLKENEKIYLIKRRHPFIIITGLFFTLLICFLIIIGIFYILFSSTPEWLYNLISMIPFFTVTNIKYLALFILSLLLLILWQSSFIIIADYYLDCWVITNQRTIHTELRGLFSRFYSTVPNNRIQDVTSDIEGFFPTLLNYGNLYIHTAGAFKDFVFRQIPEPGKTKDILLKVLNHQSEENIDDLEEVGFEGLPIMEKKNRLNNKK